MAAGVRHFCPLKEDAILKYF
jgi:cytochrome P450